MHYDTIDIKYQKKKKKKPLFPYREKRYLKYGGGNFENAIPRSFSSQNERQSL